jgi:hypothetical protein
MHKYLAGTAGLGVGFLAAVLFTGSVLASNTHSISLNGSDQYLSIAEASQTGLGITGDMTLEAWVKPNSQPSNQSFEIASKWGNSPEAYSYIFAYRDNAGTKELRMYASSDGTGSTFATAAVNHSLSSGVWHHVAFVYTASSGGLEAFVDGVKCWNC